MRSREALAREILRSGGFSPRLLEGRLNHLYQVNDYWVELYAPYLVASGIKQEHYRHQSERPVISEDLDLVGPVGDAPVAEIDAATAAAALEVGVDQEAVLLLPGATGVEPGGAQRHHEVAVPGPQALPDRRREVRLRERHPAHPGGQQRHARLRPPEMRAVALAPRALEEERGDLLVGADRPEGLVEPVHVRVQPGVLLGGDRHAQIQHGKVGRGGHLRPLDALVEHRLHRLEAAVHDPQHGLDVHVAPLVALEEPYSLDEGGVDARAVLELREGDAVRVEEDEVGHEEGVPVGESRHGPRHRYLPRDGAQFGGAGGVEDLRAGVELGAADALEPATGEVLGHVGVEQPAQLVLAALGREVARDGVADEEGGVLAQQRRSVFCAERGEAAVAVGEGGEVLRDSEDVAGKVQLGEGRRVPRVERVQRLNEMGQQGALKSNGRLIRGAYFDSEMVSFAYLKFCSRCPNPKGMPKVVSVNFCPVQWAIFLVCESTNI